MSKAFLLSLCVFGCAPASWEPPFLSKYNVGIHGESLELQERYSLDEIDRGIDILAEQMERTAGLPQAEVLARISRSYVVVKTNPSTFMVGDILAVGATYNGRGIVITWKPDQCLATTALLHEFTHVVLCGSAWGMGSCDGEHEQLDYWRASDVADLYWSKEICTQ